MGDHQHSVHEQMPDVEYCPNDNPSWPMTILLGFQHFLTMIGTTVLIPSILGAQMGGTQEQKIRAIQTLLFISGINTLLQGIFGIRLPAVVGGSFTYVIPIMTIINSARLQSIYDDHTRFVHTMREIQGGLICASLLQIVLGFGGVWGLIIRFLSPLAHGPIIMLVGLGLYGYGFASIAKCIEIGLPALIVLVLFSQYMTALHKKKKFPIFSRFPIIFGVAIVWAYAFILTESGAYRNASKKGKDHCQTDRPHLIEAAPWIRLPYPLEWGAPTFNAGSAFAMMASAVVAQIESTETLYAVSRLSNATPPPPFVVGRSIGWLGFGTLLNGLFGTITGSTILVENAGLLGITRIGSRRTTLVAALFMLVFAILGKFGAVIDSIPQSIVGAIHCLLYGVLAGVGISFLQFVNLNMARNLYILGFTLFMGFSIPHYFYEFRITNGHGPVNTNADWFNDIMNVLFSSNAVVGFIISFLLDHTLRSKVTKKDRGMEWWKKYHKWTGAPTNEEFYRLPLNLNNYFPPPHHG